MNIELGERFQVLRDEALNCAEYGQDATGGEIFDAILSRVTHMGDTEAGLDLTLRDALSRRLAWGEEPATIIVDCAGVCKRLLAATQRSFPDPEIATSIATIIADVACAAARHIARIAAQRASQERAQQRREMMVQRQLATALKHQDALLASLDDKQSKP